MYTPIFTIIPCVLVVSRDTIRHAWTSFCFTGCQTLWVQFKEECCWILWKIYFWSFDNSPHWFPEWLYQLIIPALSKGSSPRRICCWLLLLLIASLSRLSWNLKAALILLLWCVRMVHTSFDSSWSSMSLLSRTLCSDPSRPDLALHCYQFVKL